MFTKSNVRDDFTQCIAEVADSATFFADILQHESMDLLEKYQQWACSKIGKNYPTKNKLHALQTECGKLILDGLS